MKSVSKKQRRFATLLVLSMLLGLLTAGVSAAEPLTAQNASGTCKVVLEYPKDVPADEVEVTMFDGIPNWYQKWGAKEADYIPKLFTEPTNEKFPKLNIIEPAADGSYTFSKAGGYCYFVQGKEASKYYSIVKLFLITEDDMKTGSKVLPVKTGPIAGTGFEPCNNNPIGENGERPVENFNQGANYLVPFEGTDEMAPLMDTEGLKGYKPFTTPAFRPGRAMYQATTQNEMLAFIAEYAKMNPYMHVYSAGRTKYLDYDYPVLVFTKKEIPADATMDDAAKILRDGGLPIVWQQAQIHPYEPAAGESALAMIQELSGAYGEEILNKIDIVMIPRVNVEGSFAFWRGDYNNIDMNRDHMILASQQSELLHETYYKFMPHVAIDNHEFFFSEMGCYEGDVERFELNDFQITGATSLNVDPAVADLTVNLVVDQTHKDLIDTGFRAYHYGITSINPIGRAYYGIGNAISVLIESHGNDGALFSFPRRVYGQLVATKSIFNTTAANADTVMNTVNAARAKVAEKGVSYDPNDVLVLKQSASGKIESPTALPRYVADIYGNIAPISSEKIALQDTIERSRPRPTAYVVDAREPWIGQLMNLLTHHGAEYFMVKPNTQLELQQYFYIKDDGKTSCIADLRDEAKVTFPNGALVVPMDQPSGNIIGMLMEPDVGDSNRHSGTLFQGKLLKYDEVTKNFPLYRYIKDNPRGTILKDATRFTDVAVSDWFKPYVDFAVSHKLFAGVSETEFGPNGTMTRGMLAMVLNNLENNPKAGASAGFKDVDKDMWYAAAVDWAAEKGIASGYGDGRFGPNDQITREQLAIMLWNYGGKPAASGEKPAFTDWNRVNSYARPAVLWAVENGIMSGVGGEVLNPTGFASRAEAAAMLMNFMKII